MCSVSMNRIMQNIRSIVKSENALPLKYSQHILSKFVTYGRLLMWWQPRHTMNSEVMAMTELIICILISEIACEHTVISFETAFFYISLALLLYKGCLRLQKKHNKQKKSQNTNDKSTTKIRQMNQFNIGSITLKL